MLSILSRLYLLLLFASLSFALAPLNVAIMPFSGDNTVSADQLEFITSKFTGELVKANIFKVLDRGKMDFILQEQGFQQSGACNSSECKVQMGQLLGVDDIVAGKLVRFGSTYALHLEFINVSTGEIAQTVDSERKGELEDVYKTLCSSAAQTLQEEAQAEAISTQVPIVSKSKVPRDAIPKAEFKPMSTKRKVALALLGPSFVGAGVGYYFDGKAANYRSEYHTAIDNKDPITTKDAYDNTQSAKNLRNVSYSVSVGVVLVGVMLWFLQ